MKVGVLAVQGAVSEHADALRGLAEVVPVRVPADLDGLAGLIMPGGESTTISRLLRSSGLRAPIVERAGDGSLALFGTCAGMILMCSDATHDVEDKDIQLMKLFDATVDRNAFGRQRESFEANLDVEGLGTMPAVFIRAPAITRLAGARVLATLDDKIVAVQKDNLLATAFHPELTGDTRLHEHFVAMCSSVRP